MLKRFSHYFACLLLVLIPLQGFAAANMSICNSMMQSHSSEQQLQAKPCHMHMAGMSKTTQNQNNCKHKDTCKTICATLCASLSVMATLPSNIKPASLQDTAKNITLLSQSYASITLPSPQRPPILLS
jgi:hypothetical protein